MGGPGGGEQTIRTGAHVGKVAAAQLESNPHALWSCPRAIKAVAVAGQPE